MARLRAPAPFAGRGAGGLAACGVPPLTILNFSGLPAALCSAARMTRFGSGPSATSIRPARNTDLDRQFPVVQRPLAFLQVVRNISCPASSSAASTALRNASGEISPLGRGSSTGGSSATAIADPVSIDSDAGAGLTATACGPMAAVASAFGPLLRLRSASNGEGLPKGEAAGSTSSQFFPRSTTA